MQKLSSADEKIEAKLKNSADDFSKFQKSVEEQYNSIDESFSDKFQQSDDKISELSAIQKKISELTLNFEDRNNAETTLFDKTENISVHLKTLGEQIENQIGYLNTSLRGYVLSITSSQEEN